MTKDSYKPDEPVVDNLPKKVRPLCPYCGTKLTFRIKRGIPVKIFLFFLPLKHYACTNCRQNSYSFK